MADYPTRELIVRETYYPYATRQEVVGELVRCKDCWKRPYDNCPMEWYWFDHEADDDCFCKYGEREMQPYEDGEREADNETIL